MALNAVKRAAIRHILAYESSPPEARLSHSEWCKVVGITPRAMEQWRKESEFAAALDRGRADMEATADPFALVARQWALEQLIALYTAKGTTATEKRQVLKEIMERTAHVAAESVAVDYSELSDSDLLALALERDISPLAMTEAELARMAKGGSDVSVPARDDGGCRDDGAGDGACDAGALDEGA